MLVTIVVAVVALVLLVIGLALRVVTTRKKDDALVVEDQVSASAEDGILGLVSPFPPDTLGEDDETLYVLQLVRTLSPYRPYYKTTIYDDIEGRVVSQVTLYPDEGDEGDLVFLVYRGGQSRNWSEDLYTASELLRFQELYPFEIDQVGWLILDLARPSAAYIMYELRGQDPFAFDMVAA